MIYAPNPGQQPWIQYWILGGRRGIWQVGEHVTFPFLQCFRRTEIDGVVARQTEEIGWMQVPNGGNVNYTDPRQHQPGKKDSPAEKFH